MSDIERRNRLTDHEPSTDGHGECFIAIHMMDGSVQTISGIADTVTIKPDNDGYDISWSDKIGADDHGWDVTVHFNSNLIREAKSMDGKAAY